jgi:serine/threonine-protein kinase RsbW
MTATELRLTLANDLDELAGALEAADAFLHAHRRAEETRYAVRLVLEELLSNVIRHGCAHGARHTLAVRLAVVPDAVELDLVDDARAFDPLSAPPLDVAAPLERRQPGGMGIHLVRSTARELRYRRAAGRNHLHVRI